MVRGQAQARQDAGKQKVPRHTGHARDVSGHCRRPVTTRSPLTLFNGAHCVQPSQDPGVRAAEQRSSLFAVMYEVHRLVSSSKDVDATLPILLQFSNVVFSANTTSKHTTLAVWRERLSLPSSAILYITSTGQSPPTRPEEVIAFLFVHPRTHSPPLSTGETETLHIWLAGVQPEQRRLGLLRKMMDDLFTRVTGRVTICTIPDRFPNMWGWLTKRGWEVERNATEGRILLSKLASG